MIEDIQRRRQERIREIIDVKEAKCKARTPLVEFPIRMERIAEGDNGPTTKLPLISVNQVNQEHWRRHDAGGLGSEQSHDPEKQWKINQTKWNKRYGWEDKHTEGTTWRSLRIRMLISTLLSVAVYGLMAFPLEWNSPMRAWIVTSLTEEMDMRPLADWYERTFSGTPAFIPIFPKEKEITLPVKAGKYLNSPIKGKIVKPFVINMKSVALAPDDSGSSTIEVRNVATGRVERVMTDTKEGITVMVRHAEGLITLYGGLSSSSVQKDDWLEGNETIGVLQSGGGETGSSSAKVLIFSMQQHGAYIDPSDVIHFD